MPQFLTAENVNDIYRKCLPLLTQSQIDNIQHELESCEDELEVKEFLEPKDLIFVEGVQQSVFLRKEQVEKHKDMIIVFCYGLRLTARKDCIPLDGLRLRRDCSFWGEDEDAERLAILAIAGDVACAPLPMNSMDNAEILFDLPDIGMGWPSRPEYT